MSLPSVASQIHTELRRRPWTTRAAQAQRQELAQRQGDGIEVTMFWSAEEDELTLRLVDLRAGACFEIPVRRDRGNFAFNHPFAYAAEQGSMIPPASFPAA